MVRLFLSGIPGTGKTPLIQRTKKIAKGLGQEVHSISLGDIVKESAKDAGVDDARLLFASAVIQDALRSGGAMYKCAGELAELAQQDNVIIECPLTLLSNRSVPCNTFVLKDFDSFRKFKRGIHRIICLINDPHIIAKTLEASHYATNIENILTWTGFEVNRTRDMANLYSKESSPLVIPYEGSDTTLTKILFDSQTIDIQRPTPIPTIYSAAPISGIKKLEKEGKKEDAAELRKQIIQFRQRLQEYAVVILPMELADQGVTEPEIAHTVNRDLNWFVRWARFTIAYFPENISSSGVNNELKEALQLGKPTVLIHPKPDSTPFGHRDIPYVFKEPEEFFTAIAAAKDDEAHPFRTFLYRDGSESRYAHIEEVARKVA